MQRAGYNCPSKLTVGVASNAETDAPNRFREALLILFQEDEHFIGASVRAPCVAWTVVPDLLMSALLYFFRSSRAATREKENSENDAEAEPRAERADESRVAPAKETVQRDASLRV